MWRLQVPGHLQCDSSGLSLQSSSLYEERYVLPLKTLNSQGGPPPQETHPLLGEWNVSILVPKASTHPVIGIIRRQLPSLGTDRKWCRVDRASLPLSLWPYVTLLPRRLSSRRG